MNDGELVNRFTYHAPVNDQAERYAKISAAALEFARVVNSLCPECADKTHALRVIADARMWANGSIACNEVPWLSQAVDNAPAFKVGDLVRNIRLAPGERNQTMAIHQIEEPLALCVWRDANYGHKQQSFPLAELIVVPSGTA